LRPEMARQGEDMRCGVTAHVRAQLDRSRNCSGAALQQAGASAQSRSSPASSAP
jgi:hypothetical protein